MMRTLTTLTAGAVVLLALAGCSNDPKSGIAALEAPAGAADKLAGDYDYLRITPDSVRLLVEENGYAFYAAVPDNPVGDGACLVIEELKTNEAHSGCGSIPSVEPLGLGIPSLLPNTGNDASVESPGLDNTGLQAKLVVDDYDASKELSEGWKQLHKNLLVLGL